MSDNIEIYTDLIGKTIREIQKEDDTRLEFFLDGGAHWVMYHSQDCCESVTIEDICGDLDDLIGSPLTMAECVNHENMARPEGVEPKEFEDSFTWTFYKFATVKGAVTIRWLGMSNGYYSESVEFVKA